MDLKSAVRLLNETKGDWQSLTLWEYRQELETLLSFCETVLRLQKMGMPKKKNVRGLRPEAGNHFYNQAIDEMTAWLCEMHETPKNFYGKSMYLPVSKVNVERLEKVIEKETLIQFSEMINGKHANIRKLAEAIVNNILGKE